MYLACSTALKLHGADTLGGEFPPAHPIPISIPQISDPNQFLPLSSSVIVSFPKRAIPFQVVPIRYGSTRQPIDVSKPRIYVKSDQMGKAKNVSTRKVK